MCRKITGKDVSLATFRLYIARYSLGCDPTQGGVFVANILVNIQVVNSNYGPLRCKCFSNSCADAAVCTGYESNLSAEACVEHRFDG